jgi:pimeloyl-ACP methyl ester carboxylesterase
LKENGFLEMMKSEAGIIYRDFIACDRFSMIGSVEAIHMPVLVVCGKDDHLTPPAYSDYLHNAMTGSRLNLIDDAGHMVMLEKPDELNRAIEGFVAENR